MIQIGLVLIVSALFLATYVIGCIVMADEPHPAVIMGVGILLSAIVGGFYGTILSQALNPDTYYLPCEVVATNDYCTYFGTVDSDSQEICAVETSDHIWPDDVPYLLHMDTKGSLYAKQKITFQDWLAMQEEPEVDISVGNIEEVL